MKNTSVFSALTLSSKRSLEQVPDLNNRKILGFFPTFGWSTLHSANRSVDPSSSLGHISGLEIAYGFKLL